MTSSRATGGNLDRVIDRIQVRLRLLDILAASSAMLYTGESSGRLSSSTDETKTVKHTHESPVRNYEETIKIM